MKFGNVYEQLDNMHRSVPEHSYQYDIAFMSSVHIIQMIIMYSYQTYNIYKSSKGVNKY